MTKLRVVHIYEKDVSKFESQINAALDRLVESGATGIDIQYQSDPATDANKTGGFSALIVYESPS